MNYETSDRCRAKQSKALYTITTNAHRTTKVVSEGKEGYEIQGSCNQKFLPFRQNDLCALRACHKDSS
jgi:hypothetical protein